MTSSPETLGGRTNGDLERRQEISFTLGKRKLLQEELCGFLQVDRLVQRRPLADRANFRAFGDLEIAFLVEDCGKRSLPRHVDLSSYSTVTLFARFRG
jgi:hypothetical protein